MPHSRVEPSTPMIKSRSLRLKQRVPFVRMHLNLTSVFSAYLYGSCGSLVTLASSGCSRETAVVLSHQPRAMNPKTRFCIDLTGPF
jgi:hypothetical protein